MDVGEFVGRAIVAMGLSVLPTRSGMAARTVRCENGETVRINDSVVIIDHGTVIGDGNSVVGDHNRIVGSNCRAVGSHNIVISMGGASRNHATKFGASGRLDLSALKAPPSFDRPLPGVTGGIMMMHDAGEAEGCNDQVDPATGLLVEARPKRTTRRPRRIADASSAAPPKRGASPSAKRIKPKRRGAE
jgi:hypothetical protein